MKDDFVGGTWISQCTLPPMKKYVNNVPIIITVPLMILFVFPILFLPPLATFTVSVCEFYFWRLSTPAQM